MAKKTKTLGKLKQEAQVVFNAYIRERDKDQPCISTNQYCEKGDCGHFFSVKGYDSLRYNEDNAHKESVYSNRYDESQLIGYRDNLLNRIGQERFDALYERADQYKKNGYKFTRSELMEIKQYYQTKLNELKH